MDFALFYLPLLLAGLSFIKTSNTAFKSLINIIVPIVTLYILINIPLDHDFKHIYLGFKFEVVGRSFNIFLHGMWLITNLYTIGYKNQKNYSAAKYSKILGLIALSIFWTEIATLAVNSITVVLAYEMLTITTFFLVNFDSSPESYRGARMYISILMSTSVALLIPYVILINITMTDKAFAGLLMPEYVSLLMCLLVFGSSKNATFPFYGWLNAAMVAPIPVSGLLHAVAVVNTGIIIVLKFYVYTIHHNLVKDVFYDILVYASVITIFLPVFIALKSASIKSVLANSTVSQLGLLTFFTIMLPKNQRLVEIVMMQLFAHGIAKIILFFIAGEFYAVAKSYNLTNLQGISKAKPLTCLAFVVVALSICGIPPLVGFYTKTAGYIAIYDSAFSIIIILSSLASLIYFIRVFNTLYMTSDNKFSAVKTNYYGSVAISIATVLLIAFGFFIKDVVGYLWSK